MKEKNRKVLFLVNTAFSYAAFAMAGGVFYREFTKINGFSGRTALAFVHTHLFLLGMIFFLVAALFQFHVDIAGQKRFRFFYILYNIGVAVTVAGLIARGIFQVMGTGLSRGADASLSGMSGIGHICVGIGMLLYFFMLRGAVKEKIFPEIS